MRIPRIHVEHTLQPGAELRLDGDAAHYLAGVLRMQPGRSIILFNGRGGEFTAEIAAVGKRQLDLRVGEARPDAGVSPLSVELAVAVSRGERFDWIVQKSTELGVTRIQPIWSERVEVKLDGRRLDRKLQHWRRISIGACEQCGRTRVPELPAPLTLQDYLGRSQAELRLLLHPAEAGRLDRTDSGPRRPQSAALLVGPEGGWDDGEVAAVLATGFQPWQLGPRILRTETAPVAALAILQDRFGDL